MTEPDFDKRYTLRLDNGAVIDVVADALEIADMMVFYRRVGRDMEPMRGINVANVLSFEVHDFDPADIDVEDSAPTIMDSAWGFDPGQHTRPGNPYSKAEPVPDPFRGSLRFSEE